jgi:hypothetical protein
LLQRFHQCFLHHVFSERQILKSKRSRQNRNNAAGMFPEQLLHQTADLRPAIHDFL